ncbi:MAG: hypothetical protein MUP21_02750 [Dehalococcoidia bacterium]|nr:hypothetical protein [Dehalococcoidia bacterium]
MDKGSGIVVTNFFRVEDREAFRSYLRRWALGMTSGDEEGLVGFMMPGICGLPRRYFDEASGLQEPGDLIKELSELLCEGQIAIVVENVLIPERKILRSVAIAVCKGREPIRVTLGGIRNLIREKWGDVPAPSHEWFSV